MKIKKLLVTTLLLGLTQVNAQEAVVTSGGNTTGTNGNVSYSVGQIVYTTNSGATIVSPGSPTTQITGLNFNTTTVNYSHFIMTNPTNYEHVQNLQERTNVFSKNVSTGGICSPFWRAS